MSKTENNNTNNIDNEVIDNNEAPWLPKKRPKINKIIEENNGKNIKIIDINGNNLYIIVFFFIYIKINL